jgi:exodeoxyribonuclease VII large subunit
MPETVTVSELTGKIKQTIEENFNEISVLGEISNFKAHISGHWYFTLKDSGAQISCAMWKGMNSYVFFTPKDGMKIVANGRLTVYPPRGSYQIDVRSMKPAGVGELQKAFEELKKKLFDEGLFDEAHKKPIPMFPQKIGVATAIDGAALQDMINIAKRRYPLVELVVVPTKVQGDGSAKEIVGSIKLLNKQKDIDLIIIGRGGGSLEDLWSFNEEIVARAIYDSEIPVISAVGHEIDFTIADFVSDLRAPTPSAAMEIATPEKTEILGFINDFSTGATQKLKLKMDDYYNKIANFIKSYGFRIPRDLVRNKTQQLDNLISKLQVNVENKLNLEKNRLTLTQKLIESYNVQHILKRGFAIIRQDEKIVHNSGEFKQTDDFLIQFFDNTIKVKKDG